MTWLFKPTPTQKKDEQKQQQANASKDKSQEKGEQQTYAVGQMTPQQAVRLLESAKQEERTLLLIPPNRTNRNDRLLKDW